MPTIKIVGRGVDTFVLNVCYADTHSQPLKKDLSEGLQNQLNQLQNAARMNESPVLTYWVFKGIHLFMQEKGSHGQWRWILKSPLLTVAFRVVGSVASLLRCASLRNTFGPANT